MQAFFRTESLSTKKQGTFLGCAIAANLFCGLLFSASTVYAEEFFNPALLSSIPGAVADLSRFEGNNSGQAPGVYRVEIYLNDDYIFSQDIRFSIAEDSGEAGKKPADDTGLQACITPELLKKMNVNLIAFPLPTDTADNSCVDLSKLVAQAGSRFAFEDQRLYISIPQIALKSTARGYIPPDEWQNGIPALMTSYNFTGSNSQYTDNNTSNNSYFMSLNNGLNAGPWRLRNTSTWSYSSGNGQRNNHWQNVSTYLQRNIIALKSSMLLGDSYTPGEIFDSIGFRGFQMASDDNMLPDSLRGFAPTIHGVANSNAKVTVKQNGYVIYQTYVSPGAFDIDDLYPTSSSGDLVVTVTESDGSINQFTVPYSTVPILQREGRVKFAITGGEYRTASNLQDNPHFSQGTLIWGLPAGITLYGGSQLANNYRAFAMGMGKNWGDWGAASLDITQANSVLANESHHNGQSLRFLYAKSMNDMGTNFQLLGYRYSTKGFYTLADTAYRSMSGYNQAPNDENIPDQYNYLDYYNLNFNKKGKLQLTVTQQLDGNGSLFISGNRQTYWQTSDTTDMLMMGYNGYWGGVSYSINYAYNKTPGIPSPDKRIAFSLSFPLNKLFSNSQDSSSGLGAAANNAYATYNASRDNTGSFIQQAGVSGTLLQERNLNYSVQQGYGNHGAGENGNAGLRYQGGYGNSNLGYNYSRGYRQVNYGVSGGIVAHSGGVTFSQPLGDTNVLIYAPGVKNVPVQNATGVSTDWRGYTVLPYATTYRRNRVALNIDNLNDNTDIESSVMNVVPTQGAMVRADFVTHIGARALLTLKQKNGKPVPFGAMVTVSEGSANSIVGDGGQVYLSGLPQKGALDVVWGNGNNQQCKVTYTLPADSENNAINYAQGDCQ